MFLSLIEAEEIVPHFRSLRSGFILFVLFFWKTAYCVTIPDPSSFLDAATSNAMVQTIGLAMDHRSYEPATPLGTALGLDFGIEITLARPPDSLATALSTLAGGSSGLTSGLPILPSARFHLHKGLSEFLDLGVSYLPAVSTIPYIGGTSLLGFDLKYCFFRPEEGLTWAFRASYNLNTFQFQQGTITQLTVITQTITPQLLISKKLDFADPYIGIGYQYTFGNVGATITLPSSALDSLVSIAPINISHDGSGSGGVFFGGISFKAPVSGLRLTLEMAYSTVQVDYVGTKIGFSF